MNLWDFLQGHPRVCPESVRYIKQYGCRIHIYNEVKVDGDRWRYSEKIGLWGAMRHQYKGVSLSTLPVVKCIHNHAYKNVCCDLFDARNFGNWKCSSFVLARPAGHFAQFRNMSNWTWQWTSTCRFWAPNLHCWKRSHRVWILDPRKKTSFWINAKKRG